MKTKIWILALLLAPSLIAAPNPEVMRLMARKDYEGVLRIDPENFAALGRVFDAAVRAGEDGKAVECYARLRVADKGSGVALVRAPLAAVALERLGMETEARDAIGELEGKMHADVRVNGYLSRRAGAIQALRNLRAAEAMVRGVTLRREIKRLREFAEGLTAG